jgi:hypothetical protein
MDLIHNAHTVFVNGFIFDELRLDVVQEACQKAIAQGGAIFFDPGAKRVGFAECNVFEMCLARTLRCNM